MISIYCDRLLRRLSPAALALALVALAVSTAAGQTDQGRISGRVVDQNNAVIPGATVKVVNDRTGDERTATTDADGLYFVSALKASSYTITVNASGFSERSLPNQPLTVGQALNLDVMLKIGEVGEALMGVVVVTSPIMLPTNDTIPSGELKRKDRPRE